MTAPDHRLPAPFKRPLASTGASTHGASRFQYHMAIPLFAPQSTTPVENVCSPRYPFLTRPFPTAAECACGLHALGHQACSQPPPDRLGAPCRSAPRPTDARRHLRRQRRCAGPETSPRPRTAAVTALHNCSSANCRAASTLGCGTSPRADARAAPAAGRRGSPCPRPTDHAGMGTRLT